MNQQSKGKLDVKVRIRSFPFLGRLLVEGEVSRVEVVASNVREEPLTFQEIRLDINHVRIDRNEMLSKQRLYLRGTGTGAASAEITGSQLEAALGIPVQVVDGAVETTIAGRRVRADVTVKGGVLRLAPQGAALPVSLPSFTIPAKGMLPCPPNATFAADRIHLACRFTTIPTQVMNLVNGAVASSLQ